MRKSKTTDSVIPEIIEAVEAAAVAASQRIAETVEPEVTPNSIIWGDSKEEVEVKGIVFVKPEGLALEAIEDLQNQSAAHLPGRLSHEHVHALAGYLRLLLA